MSLIMLILFVPKLSLFNYNPPVLLGSWHVHKHVAQRQEATGPATYVQF